MAGGGWWPKGREYDAGAPEEQRYFKATGPGATRARGLGPRPPGAVRVRIVANQGCGLTSTKPAALKSPSNANASPRRSRRMVTKLVASTNE